MNRIAQVSLVLGAICLALAAHARRHIEIWRMRREARGIIRRRLAMDRLINKARRTKP